MRGLQFLWDAFWELTTERPMGMAGEGRIPGSAIREYAREHGYYSDDARWFREVIREMDAEYLGLRTEEPPTGLINETPLSDVKGVKAMLRKFAKPKPEAAPDA